MLQQRTNEQELEVQAERSLIKTRDDFIICRKITSSRRSFKLTFEVDELTFNSCL